MINRLEDNIKILNNLMHMYIELKKELESFEHHYFDDNLRDMDIMLVKSISNLEKVNQIFRDRYTEYPFVHSVPKDDEQFNPEDTVQICRICGGYMSTKALLCKKCGNPTSVNETEEAVMGCVYASPEYLSPEYCVYPVMFEETKIDKQKGFLDKLLKRKK